MDRLIDALERAQAASGTGAASTLGEALAEALGALGGLYGLVDTVGHPEVSNQLTIVYEMCLRHIAMVHRGRPEMLSLSLGVLRPIRAAFVANEVNEEWDVEPTQATTAPRKTTIAA